MNRREGTHHQKGNIYESFTFCKKGDIVDEWILPSTYVIPLFEDTSYNDCNSKGIGKDVVSDHLNDEKQQQQQQQQNQRQEHDYIGKNCSSNVGDERIKVNIDTISMVKQLLVALPRIKIKDDDTNYGINYSYDQKYKKINNESRSKNVMFRKFRDAVSNDHHNGLKNVDTKVVTENRRRKALPTAANDAYNFKDHTIDRGQQHSQWILLQKRVVNLIRKRLLLSITLYPKNRNDIESKLLKSAMDDDPYMIYTIIAALHFWYILLDDQNINIENGSEIDHEHNNFQLSTATSTPSTSETSSTQEWLSSWVSSKSCRKLLQNCWHELEGTKEQSNFIYNDNKIPIRKLHFCEKKSNWFDLVRQIYEVIVVVPAERKTEAILHSHDCGNNNECSKNNDCDKNDDADDYTQRQTQQQTQQHDDDDDDENEEHYDIGSHDCFTTFSSETLRLYASTVVPVLAPDELSCVIDIMSNINLMILNPSGTISSATLPIGSSSDTSGSCSTSSSSNNNNNNNNNNILCKNKKLKPCGAFADSILCAPQQNDHQQQNVSALEVRKWMEETIIPNVINAFENETTGAMLDERHHKQHLYAVIIPPELWSQSSLSTALSSSIPLFASTAIKTSNPLFLSQVTSKKSWFGYPHSCLPTTHLTLERIIEHQEQASTNEVTRKTRRNQRKLTKKRKFNQHDEENSLDRDTKQIENNVTINDVNSERMTANTCWWRLSLQALYDIYSTAKFYHPPSNEKISFLKEHLSDCMDSDRITGMHYTTTTIVQDKSKDDSVATVSNRESHHTSQSCMGMISFCWIHNDESYEAREASMLRRTNGESSCGCARCRWECSISDITSTTFETNNKLDSTGTSAHISNNRHGNCDDDFINSSTVKNIKRMNFSLNDFIQLGRFHMQREMYSMSRLLYRFALNILLSSKSGNSNDCSDDKSVYILADVYHTLGAIELTQNNRFLYANWIWQCAGALHHKSPNMHTATMSMNPSTCELSNSKNNHQDDIVVNHPGIRLQMEKIKAYHYFDSSDSVNVNYEEGEKMLSKQKQHATIVPYTTVVTTTTNNKSNGRDGAYMTMEPILSIDECQTVIRWANDNQKCKWTTQRHSNVPTHDVPIHEVPEMSHWFYNVFWIQRMKPLLVQQFLLQKDLENVVDENVGSETLNGHLQEKSRRCDSHHPDGCDGDGNFYIHDAFVVRYDSDLPSNHLPIHTDESTHSFVVALNGDDEYTGGGTYFADKKITVRMNTGHALTFRGDMMPHGGEAVSSGTRYIIAAFLYYDSNMYCCNHCNQVKFDRFPYSNTNINRDSLDSVSDGSNNNTYSIKSNTYPACTSTTLSDHMTGVQHSLSTLSHQNLQLSDSLSCNSIYNQSDVDCNRSNNEYRNGSSIVNTPTLPGGNAERDTIMENIRDCTTIYLQPSDHLFQKKHTTQPLKEDCNEGTTNNQQRKQQKNEVKKCTKSIDTDGEDNQLKTLKQVHPTLPIFSFSFQI